MPTISHINAPLSWSALSHGMSITDTGTMICALDDSDNAMARFKEERTDAFLSRLRSHLGSPARCVVVDFPNTFETNVACMLISRCLGQIHRNRDSPLWNPVDVNVSTEEPARATLEKLGAGHFPIEGEIWHSDGSPWCIPNRWTVVGITHLAPECPEVQTAILPFETLLRDWRHDANLIDVLRNEKINWRQIFPSIGPMLAPILGPTVNRWMPIILCRELADNKSSVGKACRAVSEMLNATTSNQLYQTVLKPRQVLVFDNHKVVHRANANVGPELRRITRIRIAGRPVSGGI